MEIKGLEYRLLDICAVTIQLLDGGGQPVSSRERFGPVLTSLSNNARIPTMRIFKISVCLVMNAE